MLFNANNVVQVSPFSQKMFTVMGDGSDEREIKIDLTKAPLGMEFAGYKYPSEVFARADVAVETSIDGPILKLRFPKPLMGAVNVTVEFFYD